MAEVMVDYYVDGTLTQPDTFRAGPALRPVTDWDTTITDTLRNSQRATDRHEAYKRSSPIYHAQGLKGALLICHGMVDVNVHFQDTGETRSTADRVEEENWELAVSRLGPRICAGFASWGTRYKESCKLFNDNLRPRGM